MKIALEARELDTFGRLMDENWRRQRLLHPSVAEPGLESALELGTHNGASAGRRVAPAVAVAISWPRKGASTPSGPHWWPPGCALSISILIPTASI